MVVNPQRVVLGLLRSAGLNADPACLAGEKMDPAPRTYRFDSPLEKIAGYMQREAVASVLVTHSDGALVGLLRRGDLDQEMSATKKA